MRRSQTDKTSQPVRNIAGNPAFKSTTGNQTIRTNLILNPSFELPQGANGTVAVRTNLCQSPRGVTTLGGYSGELNQTITTNVAITGHPEGITTATRVEYAATGASNPGVHFINPVVAGTLYTMSLWVYHETIAPTAGSQGFAQAGVISMPSPPAIVQGVWTKVSWTHTVTGTSQIGFRVSGQSGGAGSYLITGILIENAQGPAGQFFDGDTVPASNLVPNPSFTTNTTSWTPISATLTRVTNQGGDGAVCEITQTTAGAVRQSAVALMGSMQPAGNYTISFDMKGTDASFTDVRVFCYDSVAVAVRAVASTPLNKDGNFNRYTFAVTATGEWDRAYMEVQGVNIPVGTKCWIDRAMIEKTENAVGIYYEGAGDYTYAWTGTANASTSQQQSTKPAWWSQATNGMSWVSNTVAVQGTKCAGVRTRGFNGDGVYAQDIDVVPGATYTFSAWIKITASVPTLSGVLRFKSDSTTIISDLGGTVHSNLVIGEWVRVSVSGLAPAGSAKLQAMWRIYASHSSTTFYVDGAMVEQSPTLSTYFDGNTTAAGDFTYAWSGTAHSTTSLQRALSVPQVTASKSSAILDSKFFAWQSTAEDGAKTLKYVSPAGTASSSWRVSMISGSSSQGWDMSKVKAGNTYTYWMRYRTSGWGAGQTFYMLIADGTNLNQLMSNSTNIPLNATGWQEFRRTFTATRDATTSSQIYMPFPVLPQTGTDGIFEIREWMLVEGEYNGDYIDGSKPFSKWDGTADLSTSVGYGQELIDIAGTPILDYTDPGTYLLDDSFGPQEGRSFYTVFEGFAENMGPVSPILQYGDNNLNDTVPNTYIQLRQDMNSATPNGTNNLFLRRTGAAGVGYFAKTYSRHVAAWGVNDLGQLYMGANGATRLTDTAVTMSLLHQRLLISSEQPLNRHIRTIAFRGVHDSATALAVQRYLGNKYGANVA